MRIDQLLVKKGFFDSRNKAKESILRGEVYVGDQIIDKPSFYVEIKDEESVTVKRVATEFVSIGGFKLEKALNDFNFNVSDLICADIGASTGGFTDCLIKRGAKKVYAVDLSDSLLSERLNIPSVIKVVKNARFLSTDDFSDKIDLLTADLSFISETLLLPVFNQILSDNAYAIILIKPQFESDKRVKRKNGIVKSFDEIYGSIKKVVLSSVENGFTPIDVTIAPEMQGKNKEYLILLLKQKQTDFDVDLFCSKIIK